MRVRYGDLIIVCDWAIRKGRILIFGTRSREIYCTDEYYHENIAACALGDLFANGYLTVKNLKPVQHIHIESIDDLMMITSCECEG